MSRKDYELIANVMKWAATNPDVAKIGNAKAIANIIAYRFAIQLSAENPAFKQDKFMREAGF